MSNSDSPISNVKSPILQSKIINSKNEHFFKEGKIEIHGSAELVSKLTHVYLLYKLARPVIICLCTGLLYHFYGEKITSLLQALTTLLP